MHRHLDRAPDARSALAWIYRIATNYCLNELRDRRHRPEPRPEIPDRAEALPERPGKSLEDLLADRALCATLIARAPEKVRVVAWLHFMDGLDQAEVAELLGITRRTVFNRLAEFSVNSRKFLRRTS